MVDYYTDNGVEIDAAEAARITEGVRAVANVPLTLQQLGEVVAAAVSRSALPPAVRWSRYSFTVAVSNGYVITGAQITFFIDPALPADHPDVVSGGTDLTVQLNKEANKDE
jgi:hypothetical protein